MTSQENPAAERFRRLHSEGLLVLPNAWDAGSARLIESLGAKAIATTSAGVAWSHGYPDGDTLPLPLLRTTVADIARAVRVPVSADVEGGYSNDPVAVGETVAAVIEAGAVGINIEDGSGAVDLLVRQDRAGEECRRAARRETSSSTPGRMSTCEDWPRRSGGSRKPWRAPSDIASAGADGIFVPGLADPEEIRAVAQGTPLPLNIMAWGGLPSAAELEALGVRRLSAGAGIVQAAYAKTRRLAAAFLERGASDAVTSESKSYPEINALLADRRERN